MFTLPQWLYPGDGRPQREIDDEITEELQLHLDLLAEERVRAGETPDEAKQHAAERFGDFDKFLRQCRVEKQGDVPMLKRIQVVATVLLLIVVSFLAVRDYVSANAISQHMDQTTAFLKTIKEDLDDLRGTEQADSTDGNHPSWKPVFESRVGPDGKVTPTVWLVDRETGEAVPFLDGTASTPPSDSSDQLRPADPVADTGETSRSTGALETYVQPIELLVVDPDNKPIEGARVFVASSQKGFNGSPFVNRPSRESGTSIRGGELTNSEGYFRATLALSKDFLQTDLTFVCVAPGYAIATCDTVILNERQESRRITLSPSTPLKLRIVDQDGQPIRRTSLFPNGRTDLGDRSHYLPEGLAKNAADRLIDFNASCLREQTDDNGEVSVDWFEARDLVTLSAKPRGRSLEQGVIQFEVPSDPNQVVMVTRSETDDPFGGHSQPKYRISVENEEESKPRGRGRLGRGGGLGAGGFGSGGGEFGGGGGGGFGAADLANDLANLTGGVAAADGDPIADADVLLIVKTWPGGRYRQDDYALKTDANGGFTLEEKIPRDAQYGVNAVIVAEGHALASQYVLVKDPAGEDPGGMFFTLPSTDPIQIFLVDSAGEPIANAEVAPSQRGSSEEPLANVYFQGSQGVWKKTDGKGVVTIDWFADGDQAEVLIRRPGGEWVKYPFHAVNKTEKITLEGAPSR